MLVSNGGIPGSLKAAGFPWVQGLSDEDIIEQAMVARVSSKGQPVNEGVGLTLSSRIVELMGGHMLIASGAGTVIRGSNAALKNGSFAEGMRFPGTLVSGLLEQHGAETLAKLVFRGCLPTIQVLAQAAIDLGITKHAERVS